jgi:hypothetical protein
MLPIYMGKTAKTTAFRKVRYRRIMRGWSDLNTYEKAMAATILSHSNGEGWAKLSPIEIKQTSGGMDNRTQEKTIASLQKQGYLQIEDSDNKRKKLYRLHEPKPTQNKA